METTEAKKKTIDLNRVNAESVRKTLAELDIVPAKQDIKSAVKALADHYAKLTNDQVGECDICGAESEYGMEKCPFCLDGAESQQELPALVESPKTETPKEKKNGHANGAVTGALVPASQAALVQPKHAEQDLDTAVSELHVLQRDTFTHGWKLGQKLNEVHVKLLWKQRHAKDGSVAYKSFSDFCAAELKMHKSTYLSFMRIAKEFTEAQAAKLGSDKLSLISGKKPAVKANLLKEAEKGASVRKLREKMSEMGVRKTKAKPNEITVANLVGKKHELMLRTHKKDKETDEFEFASEPNGSWAWLDMSNDVRLTFELKKHYKKWVLTVQAKRTT